MISNIKEMKKIKSAAFGGAVSLTLATVIVKLLGVLYKIPLAGLLGDEGMGYFNAAYTVYGFFYILCTAGVPKSISILISENIVKKDEGSIERILLVSIKFFGLLGVVTAGLFALFSSPFASFIGNGRAWITMICIAPSIIFVSICGVLRGYLCADMKMLFVSVSQILEGCAKLVFGLLFAALGIRLSLPLYIISAMTVSGATLGSLVGMVYLFVVSKNNINGVIFGQNIKSRENLSLIKNVLKRSLPITVSAALMSLAGIADLFLVMRGLERLGYTVGEATALYGNYTTLAVSMFNLGVALLTPVSVAFIPILSRSFASGERFCYSKDLKDALSFTSTVCAPIAIGLSVFSKEILSLLFGDAAARVGAPLLCLLAPGIIFMSYLLILNSSLECLGKAGLSALSMVIGIFIKFFVSGILLSNSDFGISGAPIGTVISYAASAFFTLLFNSKILGYNPPVLSSAAFPYLTAFISVLSARELYDNCFCEMQSALSLALAVLCAGLIYSAFNLFFIFTDGRRNIKIAKSTKLG